MSTKNVVLNRKIGFEWLTKISLANRETIYHHYLSEEEKETIKGIALGTVPFDKLTEAEENLETFASENSATWDEKTEILWYIKRNLITGNLNGLRQHIESLSILHLNVWMYSDIAEHARKDIRLQIEEHTVRFLDYYN